MPLSEKRHIVELRKTILNVSHITHEGHVPSAYSILDILYVLYHGVLNVDPHNPQKEDRDYLVVSKGHSAIGLYAVLADAGFFPQEELSTFAMLHSRLGGHPDFNKVPGVEASTGSLGHGFPIAVGMAMGLRMKGMGQRVFCILGDGETNEGSVWEAIILAGQHKLQNLMCIFDDNHSIDRSIQWGDMAEKFGAFGWEALQVDGHDHDALREALAEPAHDRPRAVIARTVKGRGCRTMEDDPFAWHHRAPNSEELERMLKEIDQCV